MDIDGIQAEIDAAQEQAYLEWQNSVVNQIDVKFIETTLYGVIDGMSGTFTNEVCLGGITNVVASGSTMLNSAGAITDAMKFSIASNNMSESTNTVVAYCDFSQYGRQLSKFANFAEWQNYVRFAGRIGGVFINDWQPAYDCIQSSVEAELGHDAGFCAAGLVSLVLDAVL